MVQIFAYRSDIPYGANSYLIKSGGEYAIVDPSLSYEGVLKDHPDLDGNLKYILITHAHFDHLLYIEQWESKGGEVVVGALDAPALADAYKNCYLGFLGVEKGYDGEYKTVKEGDILPLGEDSFSVIDCPGHTLGGVAYRTGDKVFVGDTLFENGGYGRCDLPGGDIDTLERTLIKLISTLPNETVFYPGHGNLTTLFDFVKYFS